MSPRNVRPPFSTIAVVGLGLIGGSVALAVRRRWPDVRLLGVDRRRRSAGAAPAAMVDRGGSRLGLLSTADLVVLAAPVGANVRLMAEVADHLGPRAIVTDVGSTKRDIVLAARRAGLAERFVGGHPVAGSERSGADHARADMFDEATWVLTPGGASRAAIASLRMFVRGLGATVRVLTPEAHDRVFAYISHLPQVVSSTLMQTVVRAVGEPQLRLSAGGLHDTTRLAASSAAVWVDILHANRLHVSRALRVFERDVARLRHALDDPARLEAALRAGANGRRALLRDRERPGRSGPTGP